MRGSPYDFSRTRFVLVALLAALLAALKLAVVGCVVWVLASLFASGAKGSGGLCGKRYPIDRILATELFCEEKP